MEEYTEDLGSKWVKKPYKAEAARSWISLEKLKMEAERGIEGEGRWPSHGPNNSSALEICQRLADSLQSAIKADIMWGPLTEEEMPWTQFKVSPMRIRIKPNGAAKIIMDLSWPHDGELG